MSPLVGGNSPGGGQGGGQSCNVGNFEFDGGFSDVGIIMLAQFSAGGVDYQLNFIVFNGIHNIGTSLMHLHDDFGFNTAFL